MHAEPTQKYGQQQICELALSLSAISSHNLRSTQSGTTLDANNLIALDFHTAMMTVFVPLPRIAATRHACHCAIIQFFSTVFAEHRNISFIVVV